MPDLQFGLLGPLTVRHATRGAIEVPQAKHRVVLATLLLRPGQVVTAEELIQRLWGDAPPPTARKTLQGYVARLRKTLAPDVVASQPSGYCARVRPDQVDIGRLQQILDEADRSAASPAERAALLRGALGLVRGAPLADVPSEHLQRHDARALTDRWLLVLERWADAELALGRGADVIPRLRTTLGDHPFRESLWCRLLLALHTCGRMAEALDAYQDARRLLVEQLGVEPGEELRRIHRRILGGEARPEAAPAEIGIPAGARDAIEAEAVRWLAGVARTHGAFRPRAIGVYGPAGVGKTATAARIAAAVAPWFPDGCVVVRLGDGSHARDPDDVLAELLRGLGAARPDGLAARLAVCQRELARRAALVVLDDALDEEQVRPLLPRAGRSAAVITSRPALTGLDGVRHLGLQPLTTPEAVQALAGIVGAERLRGQEDAAARLVRLCDHLPLAVQAAGARLLGQPHLRLSDAADLLAEPERRLDLLRVGEFDVRASLERGYRRLEPAARRALRLVSLLQVESFPPHVAAAALDLPSVEAEKLLAAVAAQHLLGVVPDDRYGHRYRQRALVRILAREHALDCDPADDRGQALRRALSAWYRRAGTPASVAHPATTRRADPAGPWPPRRRSPGPGIAATVPAVGWP